MLFVKILGFYYHYPNSFTENRLHAEVGVAVFSVDDLSAMQSEQKERNTVIFKD